MFFFSFLLSELLRENKRMLDRSIREIERERQGLQAQEKKLITEIKKTAKEGQMVRIAGIFRNYEVILRFSWLARLVLGIVDC
jgi:transcription antitermination factor NusG